MPSLQEIQQQYITQIAPVLAALLKAKRLTDEVKWKESTKTMSYEYEQQTISWNGKKLTLTDNSGQLKMMATPNPSQPQTPWSFMPLPPNSSSLSDDDVQTFTDPNLVQWIKETLLKAG